MQTPREIFTRCLKFEYPERIPRDLWELPWAGIQFPEKLKDLKRRFPPDIVDAPSVYCPSPRVRGDAYEPGFYTDEWGSVFTNIQRGAIGEVRTPQVKDIADWKAGCGAGSGEPVLRGNGQVHESALLSPAMGAFSVSAQHGECDAGYPRAGRRSR